jgi:hypothetical protein
VQQFSEDLQQLPGGRQQLPGVRQRAPHSHRARPRRTAAAWYRWIAVFGLIALLGIVLGYHRESQPAELTATNGTPVPLLGSTIGGSLSGLATATAEFGRMPIVRVYYPGLPNPNAWTTGLAEANHSAVVVSFRGLPRTILSGADDAALRQFFDTAPTGHPIYYSYQPEPEHLIETGEFGLADFRAAWGHVAAIANAARNPDLHSTLILMGWTLAPGSHRVWKSYLPGGGIISTLGWDAYPAGSATNHNPQLTPPADFLGPAIAASRSVGLPYGFPEFGLSTAAGRPAWLTDVGQYLVQSGALFATYFNGNQQYPTLRLTDSASIAVWRDFVTQSRTGQAAPGPSPTSSPRPTASVPVLTGLHVSGLRLNPAAVAIGSQAGATLTFHLSQRSDVTVCVLDSTGRVLRTVARPGRAAGAVTIGYLRYRRLSHRLQAGRYTVLVVASNAEGSATAAVRLAVGG